MDAIWTALDKAKPCRITNFERMDENNLLNGNKSLDWMTM